MKKIEADGFVTNDKDVYQRLKEDANYNWASVTRCKDCIFSLSSDDKLYCWMHNKFVDEDYWCTYGGK